MLKKSTLLFVSIFFLLFIGLSDYGYGCHKGDGVQHGQKLCNGSGGDDEGLYRVTITGVVDGHSTNGIDWTERTAGEGIGHGSFNYWRRWWVGSELFHGP